MEIVLLFLIAAGIFSGLANRHHTRRLHKQNVTVQEKQLAFIHTADDFVYAVLESHPDLIRYDKELLELAERVATAREKLHQAVHMCSDCYRSPLRDLLP